MIKSTKPKNNKEIKTSRLKSAMVLHKADLFGYIPEEGKKEKFQGVVGAIASILIVCAFIAYTLNRFVTFITSPSVSYAVQITDTSDDLTISISNFAIAIISESPQIVDISSMVTISAAYKDGNNVPLVLSTHKCNLSDAPAYLQHVGAICFQPYVVIPGTVASQIKHQRGMTFTVTVTDCVGFMSSLPASLVTLVPDTFETDLSSRSFVNKTGYVIEKISLQPPLLAFFGLDYQTQDFVMSPDYLLKWKSENQTRLKISKSRTSYGANNGVCTNGDAIAMLELSLDSQTLTTQINYENILTMFSQVGAFWTTSILILANIFVRFNQKKHKKLSANKPNNQPPSEKDSAVLKEVSALSPNAGRLSHLPG